MQDERTHAAELTKMLTFYKASLKAKNFAEWQADKPLLCIHFGSTAASGLFPDSGILFRLLTSALERAGAKGVLLTGDSGMALVFLQPQTLRFL